MQTENDQDLPEPGRGALLVSLLAKRKEAQTGRAGSGIEQDWIEDEEYYQGIDDANRAYAATSRSYMRQWANGDATRKKEPNRSVVFLNITAPYVDASSARVADILLPTDDRSWELKPTPVTSQMRQAFQMQGADEAAIEQMVEEAKAAALEMQSEIDDCLVESN